MPRAEREAQILDAASLEFAARAYPLVHIADIARRAGISKPLIHEYFGSKEALYRATCARAGRRIVDRVAVAMSSWGEEPVDRGVDVLRAIFTALGDRPHDWKIVFNTSLPRDTEAYAMAKGFRGELLGQAAQGVGASYGAALDDPLDLSALIQVWSATVGALVDWWLTNPGTTADDMTARADRILRVLQAAG